MVHWGISAPGSTVGRVQPWRHPRQLMTVHERLLSESLRAPAGVEVCGRAAAVAA